MSSFKRKSAAKQTNLPVGTRASPANPSTIITSTGIPSLDDILGGGLPLSCSLLVLAPDPHSAYGELVQKYFIAQGLACGQQVCVVDDNAKEFISECMWMPGSSLPSTPNPEEEHEEAQAEAEEAKVKIAWRYEHMKQFQTTVPASNQSAAEEFCHTFDLTCKIPPDLLEDAVNASSLRFISVFGGRPEANPTVAILDEIREILEETSPAKPIRICIPALASPQWGDLEAQGILHFLHHLRGLLRRYPHATAAVALPPDISSEGWGGQGWIQKMSWLSDASVMLAAFTADLTLSTLFPSHHGILSIYTVPSPHTLLPPSDRFSVLRGISSTSASSGGGENNLAFKCMRKRLVFETLHLDVEGGVGERRTTPAINASNLQEAAQENHTHTVSVHKHAAASLEIELEEARRGVAFIKTGGAEVDSGPKPVKAKKKVAFRADRPDLYDF